MADTAKIAGYVRVSTDQQKEQDSHIRQRERLESWAENRGDEIDIFEDIAISGQDETRDDYRELMGDPDSDELGIAKEFDVLVVREMSRFGRSLQQVTKDIERLHEDDVDFVSLKEDIDMTSAQGKLMMHIIAAFNQFWSDWSRERAMEYVERAREEGEPLGRPKKLDHEQRRKVKELHDNGLGYATIARLMEVEEGIDVHRSTIRRYVKEAEAEAAD